MFKFFCQAKEENKVFQIILESMCWKPMTGSHTICVVQIEFQDKRFNIIVVESSVYNSWPENAKIYKMTIYLSICQRIPKYK